MIVNAIWIDGELSPVTWLCMSSWIKHGHEVNLWVYDRWIDFPAGVQLCDANEIFRSPILRYTDKRNEGSPALHANLFRYKFLAEEGGVFIDADTLCLSDDFPEGYFFSSENADRQIPNFACAYLPGGLGLMQWAFVQGMTRLDDRTAGRFGPKLLNEGMRGNQSVKILPDLSGVSHRVRVLPASDYCQLRWHQTAKFFDADPPVMNGVYGQHLWARVLRKNERDLMAEYPETSLWETWKREYTTRV